MTDATEGSAAPSRATDVDETARALGARIRALRQRRGMTLTQAAAEAELSHSFLSQVERGLERLSMASLFRIARALGTTQQDLLTEDPPDRPEGAFHVYRRESGSPVDAGTGPVAVLAQHRARFLPMVFSGSFEDGAWWQHDEEEFLYVLEGQVIVSLGDTEVLLEAGDATYYESSIRHRWRTPEGVSCRVLVVKEQQHSR
ncbi:helix-turn-helix domain-containing protein [Microbacterium paludicola]|uniref:XRE family transcriptional regulator n=1 Tax=Microbacterium paludicola TaxID=300019 RepID=A0A4Y9FV45_9MICO|nr:cupin domain-containing protein [Microbacterium paludicola]MBF0816167.1 helix-turn-helix domain-containing protein [Microbacterium paludicola]TFU33105.1 XRE family transcriptional regulator [Microbacterium paludicola]